MLTDAFFGDTLRIGWGVAVSEADPLFAQFVVSEGLITGRFQQAIQFLILFDVPDEWFSVGHDVPPSPFLRLAFLCLGKRIIASNVIMSIVYHLASVDTVIPVLRVWPSTLSVSL